MGFTIIISFNIIFVKTGAILRIVLAVYEKILLQYKIAAQHRTAVVSQRMLCHQDYQDAYDNYVTILIPYM